ncbi:MAG: WG repeat-containing protein [Lachnospiraceae bacterium]
MYCRKCGQEIEQGELFCSNCGEKVDSGDKKGKQKRKSERKVKIAVGVICLFVVFLVRVGNYYYHREDYHYLAVVKDENGKYGYVNEKGDEIIQCRYDDADNFQENGLAAVAEKTGQNADGDEFFQWGFINREGEEVIAMQYDTIDRTGFSDDGLLAVGNRVGFDDDGKERYIWGFINERGEEVIPIKYDDFWGYASYEWKDGLIIVVMKDEEGYYSTAIINKQGEEIISFDHEDGYIRAIVNQNLFLIEKQVGVDEDGYPEYRYGGINQKNEIVIPFEYEDMSYYTWSKGDLISASKQLDIDGDSEAQWGVINQKGEMVIPFVFSGIEDIYDSELIIVKNEDDKEGCINGEGDIIIPYGKYDEISYFSNKVACVGVEEAKNDDDSEWYYGLVNEQGQEIIPCAYNRISVCENSVIITNKVYKKGFANFDGNVIVEPQYDEISDYGDNEWAAAGKREYGRDFFEYHFEYIDRGGNIMMKLPSTYVYAGSFVKVK